MRSRDSRSAHPQPGNIEFAIEPSSKGRTLNSLYTTCLRRSLHIKPRPSRGCLGLPFALHGPLWQDWLNGRPTPLQQNPLAASGSGGFLTETRPCLCFVKRRVRCTIYRLFTVVLGRTSILLPSRSHEHSIHAYSRCAQTVAVTPEGAFEGGHHVA